MALNVSQSNVAPQKSGLAKFQLWTLMMKLLKFRPTLPHPCGHYEKQPKKNENFKHDHPYHFCT
jgi:hypothetical protein